MPYHHTVKTDKNESFIIGMIKKYWKSLTNRNAKTIIITILVIVVFATSIGLGVGLASKDSKENGSHIKTRSKLDFKVHRPDGFYEPEPIFPRNHNCDLGLRLVLSGFMGHGKSSLVNTLAGLYDLVGDDDPNSLAVSSHGKDSCTMNSTLYNISSYGISSKVLDTRGIETSDDLNDKILANYVKSIREQLNEGFDAFVVVMKVARMDEILKRNFLSFIQALVDEEAYDRVIIVRTSAEQIQKSDEEANTQDLKDAFKGKDFGLFDKAKIVYGRAAMYFDYELEMDIHSAIAKAETGRNVLEAAYGICQKHDNELYEGIEKARRAQEEIKVKLSEIKDRREGWKTKVGVFQQKFNVPEVYQDHFAKCNNTVSSFDFEQQLGQPRDMTIKMFVEKVHHRLTEIIDPLFCIDIFEELLENHNKAKETYTESMEEFRRKYDQFLEEKRLWLTNYNKCALPQRKVGKMALDGFIDIVKSTSPAIVIAEAVSEDAREKLTIDGDIWRRREELRKESKKGWESHNIVSIRPVFWGKMTIEALEIESQKFQNECSKIPSAIEWMQKDRPKYEAYYEELKSSGFYENYN